MKDKNEMMIPEEVIMSKIYLIRGVKVMLDRDLAKLYEVETRILNQAVRRNEKRFPEDFMFQMSKVEMDDWKSQIVISNSERMGLRKPPLVFTEQGVAMLSSVLNTSASLSIRVNNKKTRPTGNESGSGKKDEFDQGKGNIRLLSCVPLGLAFSLPPHFLPANKLAGYRHLSLRDTTVMASNSFVYLKSTSPNPQTVHPSNRPIVQSANRPIFSLSPVYFRHCNNFP